MCLHWCRVRHCWLGLRRAYLVWPILLLLLVGAALTALLPSAEDQGGVGVLGALRRATSQNEIPAQGHHGDSAEEEQRFTVIIQTYNRTDILLKLLNHYQAVPHLQRIIIVWNNIGEQTPLKLWNSLGPHPVPVVFKEQASNQMRNRLQPFPEIYTDGQYICILYMLWVTVIKRYLYRPLCFVIVNIFFNGVSLIFVLVLSRVDAGWRHSGQRSWHQFCFLRLEGNMLYWWSWDWHLNYILVLLDNWCIKIIWYLKHAHCGYKLFYFLFYSNFQTKLLGLYPGNTSRHQGEFIVMAALSCRTQKEEEVTSKLLLVFIIVKLQMHSIIKRTTMSCISQTSFCLFLFTHETLSFLLSSWSTHCRYSMVLIGAAFFHRRYLQLFQEQPQAVHALVDETQNCDDIAMNFAVALYLRKHSRSSGSPTRPSGVFVKPVDLRNLEKDASSGYQGMWHRPEHLLQRSYCLNRLTQIYGFMPLYFSNLMVSQFGFPSYANHKSRGWGTVTSWTVLDWMKTDWSSSLVSQYITSPVCAELTCCRALQLIFSSMCDLWPETIITYWICSENKCKKTFYSFKDM